MRSNDIPAFSDVARLGPNTRPLDMPRHTPNSRTVLCDRRDAEIMLRYAMAKAREDRRNAD